MAQTKKKNGKRWREILFSSTLVEKNISHRVGYIAVMAAFLIAANTFTLNFGGTQFSFTLFLSNLAGILIGPIFGFSAAFLGDLIGFLYHPTGSYSPFIGLSMGLAAMIAGFIVGGLSSRRKWFLYVKLAVVCLLTFLFCTVAIDTTCLRFWVAPNLPYWTYFWMHMFIELQILNSAFNALLLFIAVPTLNRIKPLKLNIQ